MVEDNYSLYPICDTNILIDLQLGNVFNKFLEKQHKINIADKVQDEMNNIFLTSSAYRKFLNIFSFPNILVIKEDHFSAEQIKSMKRILKSFNIYHPFGQHAYKKDIGEFVSILYASFLHIEKFYTNDTVFTNQYKNEPVFKGISMINLNDALREFLSDKDRINCIKTMTSQNNIMNKKLDNEKNVPLSKEDILLKLASFRNQN